MKGMQWESLMCIIGVLEEGRWKGAEAGFEESVVENVHTEEIKLQIYGTQP